jgi:hypothetical protein
MSTEHQWKSISSKLNYLKNKPLISGFSKEELIFQFKPFQYKKQLEEEPYVEYYTLRQAAEIDPIYESQISFGFPFIHCPPVIIHLKVV